MKNQKESLFKQSFEQYGKLEKIDTLQDYENDIYLFSCNLKKITNDKSLIALGQLHFLIKVDGFVTTLYWFEQYDNIIEDRLLTVLNTANKNTEYGRFFVDDDGDITWEFSFDLDEQIEDIKQYLLSCALGIRKIAVDFSKLKKGE